MTIQTRPNKDADQIVHIMCSMICLFIGPICKKACFLFALLILVLVCFLAFVISFSYICMFVVYFILMYFCCQTPDKIVHSAAHLLLSIVTTVRPQFFLQTECVQALYHSAGQGLYRDLNMEVNQHYFDGV